MIRSTRHPAVLRDVCVRVRSSAAAAVVLLGWMLAPGARAQDDDVCLTCHGDASMFEGAAAERLVVPAETIGASIHGQMGMACTDCHQDLAGSDDFPHAEHLAPVDCGVCHDHVQETYSRSLHGFALARGNAAAPTCATCHGTHDILPSSDPAAPTHRERLAETCAHCHGPAGPRTKGFVTLPRVAEGWARSVHGRHIGENGAVPTCSTCHGVHDMRGPLDPDSPIHPRNVAGTCGGCHAEVQEEYAQSIHGLALAAGVRDSPTCTDCHGEHLILPLSEKENRAHLGIEICAGCHEDTRIIETYGLPGSAVGSYEDSYHGWTTRVGYEASATCASCHTAHAILPAEHPDSSVNEAHVTATCGQCHRNASPKFASSYAHESASVDAHPVTRFLRATYWVLIAVVIGGMVLHNAVILGHYALERRRYESREPSVVRMDTAQIAQHLLLTLSFVMLAVTGFALRFPDAWWVRYLSAVGMTEAVRAWLHRGFAVALVLTSIGHVVYLLGTRPGRTALQAMLPGRADLAAFRTSMRYHAGRSGERPRFGRYDYTQKVEYWALVWGTGLMAVTGFVLWFPGVAVRALPAWIVTAAQTVHYYEAWLATLAILVWHFFFVMFHPERYPMDWVWLTGRMSRTTLRHHHPDWYDEIVQRRQTRLRTSATSRARRSPSPNPNPVPNPPDTGESADGPAGSD